MMPLTLLIQGQGPRFASLTFDENTAYEKKEMLVCHVNSGPLFGGCTWGYCQAVFQVRVSVKCRKPRLKQTSLTSQMAVSLVDFLSTVSLVKEVCQTFYLQAQTIQTLHKMLHMRTSNSCQCTQFAPLEWHIPCFCSGSFLEPTINAYHYMHFHGNMRTCIKRFKMVCVDTCRNFSVQELRSQ